MAKAIQASKTTAEPTSRAVSPADSVITIAAVLEMLILVGGLLWALNSGGPLWPRLLVVAGAAVFAAVIAIYACGAALRSAPAKPDVPESTE